MKTIIEKQKTLEVKSEYDVVVAGGGIAGVSAAISAKRAGAKKVLLIEREFALGGLATLGLVTYYLAIDDGHGRQVSYGITEELMKLSIKYGTEEESRGYPWWHEGTREEKENVRYETRFNANVFAVILTKFVKDEGVDILFGTTVCDTLVENGKITHLLVENKSGRYAIGARTVIDCTGDADVCARAGEDTVINTEGNIVSYWNYYTTKGEYTLVMQNEETMTRRPEFDGIDGAKLSQMMEETHELLYKKIDAQKDLPVTNTLATIPTIPQIRMTRRVDGVKTMKYEEETTSHSDSVATICDWRIVGPVFELPFGALHGKKIKNLITAGRIISAEYFEMWEVTRVIPVCAVTGEVAGLACAMCDDFSKIDIIALQNELVSKRGFILKRDEILQL